MIEIARVTCGVSLHCMSGSDLKIDDDVSIIMYVLFTGMQLHRHT